MMSQYRHENRRYTAGYQTPSVRLGHVHPGLIAGPPETDLQFLHPAFTDLIILY